MIKIKFKIIIVLVLITCTTVNQVRAKRTTKPNIVFFLVDDLGWADIGCNGSTFYETPRIDALAKEGVRFTNAYAACHVCSPTRASILTGKYPATLNLTDWLRGRNNRPYQVLLNAVINQNLPPEEVTIAETLRELGYSTALFGKWHLGRNTNPTEHGFDIHTPYSVNSNLGKRGYLDASKIPGFEGSKEGDYVTDRLTDQVVEYIEKNKDKPFFAYVSHFAVHDPIQGRKDLVEKYQKKLMNKPPPEGPDFILEGNPDNPNNPTREKLDELIKLPEYASTYKSYAPDLVKIKQKQDNIEFAAMVESVDESLGRILDKINELGLEDNTIVFFFSDNGAMAAMNGTPEREKQFDELDGAVSSSNLPLRGAKGWLYEGGIRVPLIVKWPGKGKKGIECDEPVISVDFYPTILAMIGEENKISEDKEGKSFVPLVRGKKMTRGPIYWHFPHYRNHGMQSPGGAIREVDYKLLDYFENGTVQLFNLRNDIGEQHDLSKIEVKKTKELKAKLDKWRIDVNAQMMKPNPNYDRTKDLWSTKE